jgi:uncharacterized membrane protein
MGDPDSSDKVTYQWIEGARRITATLSVPICTPCLTHKKKLEGINGWAGALIGIGFLVGAVGAYTPGGRPIAVVGLVMCVAGFLIQWLTRKSRQREADALRQPDCTSLRVIAFRKAIYGKNRGDVLLIVSNKQYASELASRNRGARVLSDSELSKF